MKRDVVGRFDSAGHMTSNVLLRWEEHDDVTIHPREGDWEYSNRICQAGYIPAYTLVCKLLKRVIEPH